MKKLFDGAWLIDSGRPGPVLCISTGAHGNESAPIEALRSLLGELGSGELVLRSGKLLALIANPRAVEQGLRWSEGGVDLNRCFSDAVLGRAPRCYEQQRARELVACFERHQPEALVDFHCTVEPGTRFLMQHPPASHAASAQVYRLLDVEVLLCDPELHFGGVSLDEWMSRRGRVGICYETGWIGDPENSPTTVLGEMKNLLAGCGMIAGSARGESDKRLLELDGVVRCEREGFRWNEGVGENLQDLEAGTTLGAYGDGDEVVLSRPATLVFPKKKPELVQPGQPLVYLASAV